jgi:hypothetical protein
LFASRQKLPAGYGFYFPAKDDHEDEETSNSMMVCISFAVPQIDLLYYHYWHLRPNIKVARSRLMILLFSGG